MNKKGLVRVAVEAGKMIASLAAGTVAMKVANDRGCETAKTAAIGGGTSLVTYAVLDCAHETLREAYYGPYSVEVKEVEEEAF